MNPFTNKQCRHYSAEEGALSAEQINPNMPSIPDWQFLNDEVCLYRCFKFANYHETIEFVNKLADISHKHDHHPELTVQYNQCHVRFNTHSVKGITDNDFICASLIDQLV